MNINMNNNCFLIKDRFWSRYRQLVRQEMIPYQWGVLNDAIDVHIEKERNDASIPNEKSHAIENFKIAAGISKGEHYGWVFQDSDVYKWLEAVAYSLKEEMDQELKKLADEVVDLISLAQEKDGYVNTYFSIKAPLRRFKQLGESHELYCAGHFLEAAVAYYETTGNKKVLDVACRFADCIDRNFGPEEGKIHGCDGHEEIEIGLMCLYHLTHVERYLHLCEYFLNIRGTDKDFFRKQRAEDTDKHSLLDGMDQWPDTYYQIHKPVTLQDSAEGHAVRLVYLCTAMADVAASTKNEKLLDSCKKIWRNIVDKRMYITGGIGSTVLGESFTLDYDLPNDTMYCETCAAIGLVFYAYQMLRNESKGEYGDIMERSLYNTILSGMSLDGKHFFYVNPLEAVPEKSKKDPGKSHVKCSRPEWLGCACCPPNLARLLTSIERYIYTVKEREILINLYIGSIATLHIEDKVLEISQESEYVSNGNVLLKCRGNLENPITLGMRIPYWAEDVKAYMNGKEYVVEKNNGFWFVSGCFNEDVIELRFNDVVRRWYANPKVSEDIGKVAISRGPFVFCMEGMDNGDDLHQLYISKDAQFSYDWDDVTLGGIGTITAEAERLSWEESDNSLYRADVKNWCRKKQKVKWIPYYAWANRGETEMSVWVKEK